MKTLSLTIKAIFKKIQLIKNINLIDEFLKIFFPIPVQHVFHSSTNREKKLAKELKEKIIKLPQMNKDLSSPAEKKWQSFRKILMDNILKKDPLNFFNWDIVKYNMIYRASLRDVFYLNIKGYWKSWRHVLIQKKQFNARPFFIFPLADTNTIRQAYHLVKFFDKTKTSIHQFNQIIDFGGGYGNMCKLINGIGFNGQYIIFDSPEFLLLQEYYLKLSNVSIPIIIIKNNEDIQLAPTKSILLVDDLEKLKQIIINTPIGKNLFLATWSISETPLNLRNKLFKIINPSHYLIAYQKYFGEVNNEEYFTKFSKIKSDILWKKIKMNYIPSEKNYYLLGSKK